MHAYRRLQIFCAKSILFWKNLLYLIFVADDPCHIHVYIDDRKICVFIFVAHANNETYLTMKIF